jgi:hypothetical protein
MVLVHCQSGCSQESVIAALVERGLWSSPPSRNGHVPSREVMTKDYPVKDSTGRLIATHRRVETATAKTFSWLGRDGTPGLNGTPVATLPLYRSETLPQLPPDALVVLTEGEKAASALASVLGPGIAVLGTVTGAAGCPTDAVLSALKGRRVVLWPDNDLPGHQHMARIAEALQRVGAAEVRVVNWLDAPEHGDAADYCATHGSAEVLELLESAPLCVHSETGATVPPPPPTPPALSSDPRILDRFAVAIAGCGVAGEVATAKLAYLVLTSRLLPKPVSLGVKGLSSSGKSFVVETTLRFFPPTAYMARTAISSRALIYTDEDLRHRILVLFEVDAMREGNDEDPTAYLIRSLLSEGRIDYEVTVRDEHKGWGTRHILKEGPTGLIFTTTRDQIHGENETRVLSVTSDDSNEQTRRILAALAAGDAEIDLTPWVELQTWLEGAEHRVVIPYAPALADAIPPVAVRLRRDFTAVLNLISAHAILHQATRERDASGRIVATLDDYEQVRDLVAPLISEGVGRTVSAATREAVEAVAALAQLHPEGVTATMLAERLGLDKSAARRRLVVAAQGGWVTNAEDRRGQPGRWQPGEAMPTANEVLPTVARLQAVAKAPATAQRPDLISDDPTGGTVARDPDRGQKDPPAIVAAALRAFEGARLVGTKPLPADAGLGGPDEVLL